VTPAPPGHIETCSGQWVDPFDVDPATVCVEDIAFALSNECRFGGHLRSCVADHSLAVDAAVRSRGASPLTCLHALLHDAHEYVLRDLPNPIKHLPAFDAYRKACDRAQKRIVAGLGVDVLPGPSGNLIHRCDQAVMIIEAEHGLPSKGRGWPCADEKMIEFCIEVRPYVEARMLLPWIPVEAEREWLDEYWILRGVVG